MLFGEAGAYLAAWMPDCPRDTSDVGRCVELLDLAEANGQAWRERIDELAEPFPESWGKLTGYWPRIEAAFRRAAADMGHPAVSRHLERLQSGEEAREPTLLEA